MKDRVEEESIRKKEKTLLQRYEIPIEHLDFKYVKSCQNAREVERILKVLRSGEEGYYPELEKCTATRLEELNPRSRALRVERPILRSDGLDKMELDDLKKSFLGWVDEIEGQNAIDRLTSEESKAIFDRTCSSTVPIRQGPPLKTKNDGKTKSNKIKTVHKKVSEEPGCSRSTKPNRIKSWEYDKWEKFDVDTELTKLEIESMQEEEKELDVEKLKAEQDLVKKYMKNLDLEEARPHNPTTNLEKIKPGHGKGRNTNVDRGDVPDLEDDDGSLVSLPMQKQDHIFSSVVPLEKKKVLEKKLIIDQCKIKNEMTHPGSRRLAPSIADETPHSSRSFVSSSTDSPRASDRATSVSSPGKSFIEELPDDAPGKSESKQNKEKEGKRRRFRILVEDLHVG